YIIHLAIKYPDAIGATTRKDIPGPKGVPIFGNLFTFVFKKNSYIELQQELANKYAGRNVVSNDPQTLEYVLKTKFENFQKNPAAIQVYHDLLGDGIFMAEGPMWKFQRKLISQQFQQKSFGNIIYASVIRRSEIVINVLKKYADSGKPIDLKDLFFRFTIETIGDLSFGVDFECLTYTGEESKFVTSFDYVQTGTLERIFQPFWKLTEKYSEKGQRMHEACKYIDDYVYNLINSHRSKLEVEHKPVNNMLTLLMDAVDDDGKKFNDKELRNVVMSLIFAGRNTTALSLSWMMYAIMANQSVEDSLLQEINSLLSTEKPIPSYDDIKLFKYTTATFYETLRLYPSTCIKNTVLPNNIPIYAGEFVMFNLYIMGRDEKIWGKDAKQFDPERFLNSENGLRPNRFKLASFSAGPRSCVGEQLATLETVILTILILKEFKLELMSGQKSPPEFKDSISLAMKDPLMTKVSYRAKNFHKYNQHPL
ncbi:936_t:CDS:2, partial [Racocetra persica]